MWNVIDLYSKWNTLISGLFKLSENCTSVILGGSVSVASLSVIVIDEILTINLINKRIFYYKYARSVSRRSQLRFVNQDYNLILNSLL